MSETTTTTRPPGLGAGVIAFVVGLLAFLLFGSLTLVLRYRAGASDRYEAERAAKRIEARQKIESEAKTLLTGSGWTDQAKGIVRIPLEDAMALEIGVLKQKTPRPAYSIATGAPAPTPVPATTAQPSTASASAQVTTSPAKK